MLLGRILGVFLSAAVLCLRAEAQQVITNCAEADLVAAIQKGGQILFACDGVISLSQPVVITNSVQLDATGRNVVLDGRGSNRIFELTGAQVAITNLTFSNGVAEGIRAILTTNNQSPAGDGLGGALNVSSSVVNIAKCQFMGNQAIGGEGMTLVVVDPSFTILFLLQHGSNGLGGAIFSAASSVFVQDTSFHECRALGSAPVVYRDPRISTPYYTNPGFAEGGAIFAENSTLKLLRTEFIECQAGATDAGGLWAAPMSGGAISTKNSILSSEECLFLGNRASLTNRGEAAKGGAVFAEDGEAFFLRTLFSSNSAVGGRSGRGGTGGGALWLSNRATIERCSFISNWAKGGDAKALSHGGVTSSPDIGYGGAVATFGSLIATNCTFAFNVITGALTGDISSPSSGSMGDIFGGGIFSGADANVAFCTIASNRLVNVTSAYNLPFGKTEGGGIFQVSTGILNLQATILSGNIPSNVTTNSVTAILDSGGNVSSDYSLQVSGAGSVDGQNAGLGLMTTFGRFTFFPLNTGSKAIDLGAFLNSALALDQVGFPRVVPDAGAIEWQGTEASLGLTPLGVQEMRLDVRDPSYSLRSLEGSSDLENWTELEFDDYSPQVVSGTEKRMFFRLR